MNDLVLITGVSSGVGLSLARHLAERFRVIGVARQLELAAERLADVPNVTLHRADLRYPEQVDSVLAEIEAQHGHPSRVVNNAGVNLPAKLEELDLENMQASLAVNCLAPLLVMKRLLPRMAADGFGRVINVTSGAPLNCFPGYASYSASKGALNAVSLTAANEYRDANVKVNLMSPGPVRSNMAPTAPMDPSACHPTVDYLLSDDPELPTGGFFWLGYELPLRPDLSGVDWLGGKAEGSYRKVV